MRRCRFGVARALLTGCALLLPLLCAGAASAAEEKWAGVDASVVEKIAKEQGREKRKSLIDTDQGDLLLFVFLVAGAAGGFAAGYYWRMLVAEKLPPGREGAE